MWRMFASLMPMYQQLTIQRDKPTVLLVVLFCIAQYIFGYFDTFHWDLPFGLMFFMFWWRSSREWPIWTMLSMFGVLVQSITQPVVDFGLSALLVERFGSVAIMANAGINALVMMVGVWFLKQHWPLIQGSVTVKSMSTLYLYALLVSFFITLKDFTLVQTLGGLPINRMLLAEVTQTNLIGLPTDVVFSVNHFINATLGIVLLVPLMLWALASNHYQGSKRIVYSGLIYLYLLPLLLYLSGVLFNANQTDFSEVLKIVGLVAVMAFSYYHGWRGATLAVLVVSAVLAYDDQIHHGRSENMILQLYLMAMSAMALLFGTSMDELRKSEIVLKADKSELQSALTALADSTRRGMQSEEFERKRIARELHDDMGQILTAMQTRISISQQNLGVSERESSTTLQHLSQKMSQSLKSIVNALSPDELDQLGLYSAITYGSPAQQCEMSGINYQVELLGNSLLLDELEPVCRLAAYRIVQEAVSNAVKYASCSNIQVRMRIWQRYETIFLFLSIVDDGIGLKSLGQIKHGFYSIRDRAIALNGILHVQNLPGVRVHVLLRQ